MIKKLTLSVMLLSVFANSYSVTRDQISQNTHMLHGMLENLCKTKLPQTHEQLIEQYQAIKLRQPSLLPKYQEIIKFCVISGFTPKDVV